MGRSGLVIMNGAEVRDSSHLELAVLGSPSHRPAVSRTVSYRARSVRLMLEID